MKSDGCGFVVMLVAIMTYRGFSWSTSGLPRISWAMLPMPRTPSTLPNGLGILHKEEVARHGARAKHELEGYDDALNQPTQPSTLFWQGGGGPPPKPGEGKPLKPGLARDGPSTLFWQGGDLHPTLARAGPSNLVWRGGGPQSLFNPQ